MIAVSVSAFGCAAKRPAIEAPEVHVSGLEMLEGSLFEQRIAVRLRLQNPNNMDLELNGFDLLVNVNGTRLARVISDQEVLLPRLGEAAIETVASTTTMDLLRQLQNLGAKGDGRYEIVGHAFVDNIVGRSRVEIRSEGALFPVR